jgi:hypothetical protein
MDVMISARRARSKVLEATRAAGPALLAAAIGLGFSGCRGEQARDRAAITMNPGAYLKASNVSFYDQGVVSAVTISNSSAFAVRNVEGEAVWLDTKGTRLGSTTFALTPAVPAGAAVTVSTGDGTMRSETLHTATAAATVTVTVTHLQVD